MKAAVFAGLALGIVSAAPAANVLKSQSYSGQVSGTIDSLTFSTPWVQLTSFDPALGELQLAAVFSYIDIEGFLSFVPPPADAESYLETESVSLGWSLYDNRGLLPRLDFVPGERGGAIAPGTPPQPRPETISGGDFRFFVQDSPAILAAFSGKGTIPVYFDVFAYYGGQVISFSPNYGTFVTFVPTRYTMTFSTEYQYLSNAVPEPATWSLLIGGVALVGSAMRRRRFVPSAAVA